MNPARFAVRQSVLVNLAAITLLVGGVFAYLQATREAYPAIPLDGAARRRQPADDR